MLSSLLLSACLLASPPPAVPGVAAPQGTLVVATNRGKLEFAHKQHAKLGCVECHKDQPVPARFEGKDKHFPHKFCHECHKTRRQGPQLCTSCHPK
jgi:hypothetical protein